MSWILDNIQVVLAIAGVVAYWLTQQREERRKRDAGKDDAGQPTQTFPGDGTDPEATRRVQEEIRRKIAQRRDGGEVPPPLPEMSTGLPEMQANPPPAGRTSPGTRELWDTRLAGARAREEQRARDRARRAAEHAEQLELEERTAQERLNALSRENARVEVEALDTAARRESIGPILGELQNRSGVRRAMVLREILGPPVALR